MKNSNIAYYLTQRIQHNADWYFKKNNLQTEFFTNYTDINIFYLLYFVVYSVLDEGNTVLILKQEDNKFQDISQWQYIIIEPAMILINNILSGLVDFQEIFKKIDELSDNLNELSYFIQYEKDNLPNFYQQSQILNPTTSNQLNTLQIENDIHQLSEILLWVLRFYFYTKHKLHNSLMEFVKRLQIHCLFCAAHDDLVDKPLVFYADNQKKTAYIWLNRTYHAERNLLSCIEIICQAKPSPITITQLHDELNAEQKQAVNTVISWPLSIITGGPGTGKTFTVAQIVMALYQHQTCESLALVAPTGKAAQRMKESLQKSLEHNDVINLPNPMTIHRLLGIGAAGVPHYHRANPLPYDMVIVDEASMLGVELASALLSAIKQGARLILLGDIHQLSAVEAGSVLLDLCQLTCLQQAKTHLRQSRRFDSDSGVGQLATLVNQPQKQLLPDILTLIENHPQALSFVDIGQVRQQKAQLYDFYEQLLTNYQVQQGYFWQTKQLKTRFYHMSESEKREQVTKLTQVFNDYRILTASHLSICGDEAINSYIQSKHREYLDLQAHKSSWYHGRPVMVLKNRYDLGLFNGDIGICLQSGNRANQLSVYFDGEDIKSYPIGMLDGDVVSSAYAMTVHKSQGSEFDMVAVVFDDDNQRLLCKELIYTAITRAKKRVAIYSTPNALLNAINTKTTRQTGLTINIPNSL